MNIKVTAFTESKKFYFTCHISGSSTWGKKYHVGFLKTEATAELSVDIYTPGRGTSVKITGQLAGGEIDETVVVTRDSPVSIHTMVKLYYALLVFLCVLPALHRADVVGIGLNNI